MRERVLQGIGRIHRVAFDRTVTALARAGYRTFDAFDPARHHVVVAHDVAYGPAPVHVLDVYQPVRAAKPLPVVLYVHGGGFAMLSKETHRVMALAFARHGYLVFNIDYRLGRYPAPLEDAARALLWVAEHAGAWGGDPGRIVLAGESAGGNLVTALAVAHAFPRPEPCARAVHEAALSLRAVVATYGFLDLGDVGRLAAHPRIPRWSKLVVRDSAVAYVGPDVATGCLRHPLASPLVVLEGAPKEAAARPLPPFFVSVGTRDPLVGQSRRLERALQRHGTPCELVVHPGEIHGYDALLWRPAARAKWRAAHAFLRAHVPLAGRGA